MVDDGTAAGYSLRLSEEERERYRMMAAVAVSEEGELWREAGFVEGATVADVGCGPGAVTVQLARLVGPAGRVAAVEPGAEARAAARAELDAAGFEQATVTEGTADATGLAPGSFDAVMVRHVLAHLPAASLPGAVGHLASLLRPGGHLYVVDTDLDAMRTSPADAAVDAQNDRYAAFHRSLGHDTRVGPHLPALLNGAGLGVTERRGTWLALPAALLRGGGPLRAAEAAMDGAGLLEPGEAERWEGERRRFADQAGALVWAPFFLAVGRAPGA